MSDEREFVFEKFVEDMEERDAAEHEKRREMQQQVESWYSRRLMRMYREHPLHLRGYGKK